MPRLIDIHSHGTSRTNCGLLTVRSIGINQTCCGKEYTEQGREPDFRFYEQIQNTYGVEGEGADLLYSVGVYPFDAQEVCDNWFDAIALAATDSRVWAIGEVGLDYREPYRGFAEVQMGVFRDQIHVANRLGKPLIIHQVRALDDVLSTLSDATVPAIFHGFSGSAESATRIITAGFYLSLGHLLLRNEKIQKILTTLPPEKIFFETDQSEISIESVYSKAAEIKGIAVDELSEQIEQNFRNVTRLARENRAAVG